MPVAFALVMILFIAMGITILLYLRSTQRLLKDVERDAPQVWESLRRPRWVYVRTARGGSHQIQPLLPWLKWLWNGDPGMVSSEVAALYHRTRGLLLRGLWFFAGFVVLFLILFAQEG